MKFPKNCLVYLILPVLLIKTSLSLILPVSPKLAQCGQSKVLNPNRTCIQPMYIQGCKTYQNETACLKCQPGYSIWGCFCTAHQEIVGELRLDKLIGCLVRDEDQRLCLNCAKGHVRRAYRCIVGIQNCQIYNHNNQCIKCVNHYTLVFNQCRHSKILGCDNEYNPQNQISAMPQYMRPHVCHKCHPPFIIDSSTSTCQIPNCKTLNDYGCISCQCGFYLTRDRQCRQMETGCMRYERGRCIDCVRSYRLKNGVCVMKGCVEFDGLNCIRCGEGFQTNQGGGCNFGGCIDWVGEQCVACKRGFRLQSVGCVQEKFSICSMDQLQKD